MPLQGPGLADCNNVSIDSAPWFYAQKGKSNSFFFLCLKSNKVCSYTRVYINYFPQNSISSSICWYMKWLVAKRPKLIVLLFWTSAEGDCQTEKWILEHTVVLWLIIPRQMLLPSFSSLSVHLATLPIQYTDFWNKCGTRKKNIGCFLYRYPVKILVINHPPPQVFVQNLHDFASSSMSLVTSRSNHDSWPWNHTVVSGENLIFSWSNHVQKNPGLYTAMKSVVTLYLVCKLQKKKI